MDARPFCFYRARQAATLTLSNPAPPRPVFARHAASLILWRAASCGTEVLMGQRGAGHRFMPSRLVFPGGAVDKRDAVAPAASEPRPELLAMIGHNARPRLARAIAMAAARELHEETGLSFGTPPRLDAMSYLCRAVTPTTMPMRFNARFLTAPASTAGGTLADTREMEGLRFYSLNEALSLPLVPVTREVLLRLRTWLDLPEPGRHLRPVLDVYKQQAWRTE